MSCRAGSRGVDTLRALTNNIQQRERVSAMRYTPFDCAVAQRTTKLIGRNAMTEKSTRLNARPGIDRRTLLKYSAAGSAALASSGVYMPAIAQQKPIKIGFVSPQTGPLAAFAEADNFVLGQVREATKGGLKVGNTTRPIEVVVRDSQSNPNRAAEVAK